MPKEKKPMTPARAAKITFLVLTFGTGYIYIWLYRGLKALVLLPTAGKRKKAEKEAESIRRMQEQIEKERQKEEEEEARIKAEKKKAEKEKKEAEVSTPSPAAKPVSPASAPRPVQVQQYPRQTYVPAPRRYASTDTLGYINSVFREEFDKKFEYMETKSKYISITLDLDFEKVRELFDPELLEDFLAEDTGVKKIAVRLKLKVPNPNKKKSFLDADFKEYEEFMDALVEIENELILKISSKAFGTDQFDEFLNIEATVTDTDVIIDQIELPY